MEQGRPNNYGALLYKQLSNLQSLIQKPIKKYVYSNVKNCLKKKYKNILYIIEVLLHFLQAYIILCQFNRTLRPPMVDGNLLFSPECFCKAGKHPQVSGI